MRLSRIKALFQDRIKDEHNYADSQDGAINIDKKSSRSASRKKTNIKRWLSVSLDILEQYFYVLIIRPFLTLFVVLFGLGIVGIITLAVISNYLYTYNFDLFISSGFLISTYIIIISSIILAVVFIHSLVTRERLGIVHEVIPHQKNYNKKHSIFPFFAHDLSFIIVFLLCLLILHIFQVQNFYTAMLIITTFLTMVYRTVFRYAMPLVLFENYSYPASLKESFVVFITSETKVINHTVLPLLAIFSFGIATTTLIERTMWGDVVGSLIVALYICIYYMYYYFFGFTIDYLAYVYSRIKQRIKPRVKQFKVYHNNSYAKVISAASLLVIPFLVFANIILPNNNLVIATQENILNNRLKNETPIDVISGSSKQPFDSRSQIEYRNLQFSINSYSIIQIESPEYSNICLLNITILNSSEQAYQFFPHLTVKVIPQGSSSSLPHYYDDNTFLSDSFVINPYQKYIIPYATSISGSLPFDCSNTTQDQPIVVEYNMARVLNNADDANLTIDEYLNFEDQLKLPRFNNSKVSIIVDQEDFNQRNIASTIPATLTVDSVEPITVLESRFCRFNYTIQNDWNNPIELEYYMISLLDQNGNDRSQAFIEEEFNPEQIKEVISPGSSISRTQDFNCQDGGGAYTLVFTPFEDFGPYITEEFISQTVTL